MNEWLISLAQNSPLLVYVFVALFACPVGPILSIFLGILLQMGYFSVVPIYAVLMIGDLIGDTVLYFLGYKYGPRSIDKFGKYLGITKERVDKTSRLFHKHKDPILFLSKITNGFGFSIVTLLTAGIVRIPFWRYILFNVLGQFVWTGALLYVGYTFGSLYEQIDTWMGRVSIVVGAGLLYLAYRGYRSYRKEYKLTNNEDYE